jgi:hypothetical protein
MLHLNTMISPPHMHLNTSTFPSRQLWYLVLRTPSYTPPHTIWIFRWYNALTSPLVSHSRALHFISNMISDLNLHDLLPLSFPISLKGECLNFKGGDSFGCCWILPWCFRFVVHSHPNIIMWRRDRGNFHCSECSIGRLQDQMQKQQEEISSLKLQTEQQAQQLQEHEQQDNA